MRWRTSARGETAGCGMARCYSATMRRRKPLPTVWLVSDARNDRVLEAALARLPRGSGVIFRHYHLSQAERQARFARLRRLTRARGHRLVLAGSPRLARAWEADGAYGPPAPGVALATAHDLRELCRANRFRAEAVLLSPVFATRSHAGAAALGRVRFLLLARRSHAPVLALGGMDAARFRGLPTYGWAAIDGLSKQARHTCRISPPALPAPD
jgi:thiamine-phosphate pyrophosphorylase